MIDKKTEALKLALEALESCGTGHISDGGSQWYDEMLVDTTIDVLREALTSVPDWASEAKEQPAPATELREQEPVAWRWTESNGQHWFDWRTDWTHHDRAKAMGFAIEYAYTSPPASKPWVGLTDVEIAAACKKHGGAEWWWRDIEEYGRAIEAKLREKNA